MFQLSFMQFSTPCDQQTLYRPQQSTNCNFIIYGKTGRLHGLQQHSTDFIKHPLLTLKSVISRAEGAPFFISIKKSLMVPLDSKQHPFENLAYSSLSQLSDGYSIQLNSFFNKWRVTALTQNYLHLVNHSLTIKFKCLSSQRWIWSALQLRMLNMDSQRRRWA